MKYKKLITEHYRKHWKKRGQFNQLKQGPMLTLDQDFWVLEFQPNSKRNMWTYATVGMSTLNEENPIELHIFSSKKDDSLIELLTLVAYYHKTANKLYLNHTVNFGRPWQENSKCEYGLVSLPYLDGPNLENLKTKSQFIKFFWLIPIFEAEVKFKEEFGIEALESRFDDVEFDYLDRLRPCSP